LKSSAEEVQSHLYVALDQKYISKEAFQKIYKQAEKVSKMDSGFIKYLRSQLNKPSAREIHASDSGAYLTGPSNPTNHGTQLSEKETIQWLQATYHKLMTTMSRKLRH
jgi:hypothetical protein